MVVDREWYTLQIKPALVPDDPVGALDVSLLQDNLLSPILGIKDPKTDPRIDFVGGIYGVRVLEKRAKTDMKLAFSLYPTTIAELMAVADAGRMMPLSPPGLSLSCSVACLCIRSPQTEKRLDI